MADLYTPFRNYVKKMLTFQGREKGTAKVLILDNDTTQSISVAFSQSEILDYDVFLTEKLGSSHEDMKHLIAIVFVRPTDSNIKLLCSELRKPKYGEYHIYFTNICRQDNIQELARADENFSVKEIHEFYGDFIPIDTDHYTLNLLDGLQLCRAPSQWKVPENQMFRQATDSILAACLALKQRPYIRYQSSSESAGRLAREVLHQIEREDQRGTLFDYRGNCQLVIMDRKSDPVTPLLMQWLYLGMIHEFMPIWNNRVKLASGGKEEEFVLNAQTDEFLKAHKWDNFGDLYTAVKQQTDAFAAADKRKDELLKNDMATFVEEFKDYKLLELSAKRHISLASELGRIVKQHGLTTISALEQSLACSNDHANQLKELMRLIEDPNTSKEDAIRLAVLYALHYEQKPGSKLSSVLSALRDRGVSDDMLNIVNLFLRFSPSGERTGDLFGGSGLGGLVSGLAKSIKGNSNIYTQHQPLLQDVLAQIKKNKLSETDYPFEGASGNGTPSVVVVFYVGGTTYEEAHVVSEWNAEGTMQVVLGGTHVLNSDMFMRAMKSL